MTRCDHGKTRARSAARLGPSVRPIGHDACDERCLRGAAEWNDVAELGVGGASLQYTVRGSGPGLLVPVCNFPWLDMPYFDALAKHFTVVAASPRGYQASTRLAETETYSSELIVRDLLAICDRVGLESFSVLGYSLTAAMAAQLARASSRVRAVVAGGFPLLGSYERVQLGAEHDAAALASDAERAAAMEMDFDIRAALAFYRDLARVDDGALVTDVTCPMFAFWGTADEILCSFNSEPDFGQGLTDRGVATHPVLGLDHARTILEFDKIVGDVIEWLAAATGRASSQG
jgi:pimeloyl-ACP methyl ester carboxylesterase